MNGPSRAIGNKILFWSMCDGVTYRQYGQHIIVCVSGREIAKQGGTAGYKSCPGRFIAGRTFLFAPSQKGNIDMSEKAIPYKIYLAESELPHAWYNMRADMQKKPAPLLNGDTLEPITAEELAPVFCDELIRQELDDTTAYFPIPEEIRDFYKMYRPAPLIRAYCLEEKMQTPAKIYYKFEGNNTSGSHKLNSAIAQAYYAKKQGLRGVTTETGAGQWGTALSMACSYFGLDCNVYMVKCSYEQKPFRREVMRTYGATVTPSPSMETAVGRKILAEHPGTSGSLGCAISEAVEAAQGKDGYRYVLGSVRNQVAKMKQMEGELDQILSGDQRGLKELPAFDNSYNVMNSLSDILERSVQYNISFAGVDTEDSTVRRNITLNYDCKSYDDAKTILRNIYEGEYRCIFTDLFITCNEKDDAQSYHVSVDITYFEYN